MEGHCMPAPGPSAACLHIWEGRPTVSHGGRRSVAGAGVARLRTTGDGPTCSVLPPSGAFRSRRSRGEKCVHAFDGVLEDGERRPERHRRRRGIEAGCGFPTLT